MCTAGNDKLYRQLVQHPKLIMLNKLEYTKHQATWTINPPSTICITQNFNDHNTCIVPLGDGGEGSLESIRAALPAHTQSSIQTLDPLLRPKTIRYIEDQNNVYFESASAIGLTLLTKEERNPLKLSSYGIGTFIQAFSEAKNQTVYI